MKLKEKYKFRPYNKIFPKLAEREINRIKDSINKGVEIEHVGSTAVPSLGGKGVIDILIIAPKENWDEIGKNLSQLGYEFREKASDPNERKFFHADLPDNELGTRLYHIHMHMVYPESPEIRELVGFRDYLRNHPLEAKEYAQIKEKAAKAVENLATKDEMRQMYGQMKKEFIEKILKELD